MGYYYFWLCPIIFRQQESVLDFSKKMIQATQETVSNVLLQVPNALKIVFLNREDGDQVTVLQQRISLNGVENASIAQSFLLSLNAVGRTSKHVIPQVTPADGTMIIPNTAVHLTTMISNQKRCAAHAKLLLLRLKFFPMMILPIILPETKDQETRLRCQVVLLIYLITLVVGLKESLRLFCKTLKTHDVRFTQGVDAYWTLQIWVARKNRRSNFHSYAKNLPTGIQTIKVRLPTAWMG